MLTEIFTKGEFWKGAFDYRMKEKKEKDENDNDNENENEKNSTPTSQQDELRIMAQCRVSQLLAGAQIMSEFCKRNNESVISLNGHGNLSVNIFTYEETQRRMRLIGALVEVAEEYARPSFAQKRLIVRTLRKDAMVRNLLERELYPAIDFAERVGFDCNGNR